MHIVFHFFAHYLLPKFYDSLSKAWIETRKFLLDNLPPDEVEFIKVNADVQFDERTRLWSLRAMTVNLTSPFFDAFRFVIEVRVYCDFLT